ncbi:MAG: ferrochelatase [Rubrivivax sp.]
MSARAEPSFRHGQPERTAVLLVNLGTPDAPTAPAVRRYLAEFLSDPRVIEIPRAAWWLILHGIILRTRPARSAAKYAHVWTASGSPLALWTARQAQLLTGYLGERGAPVLVRHAMRYGQPAIAATLDELVAAGATRVLLIPLYPQYSAATTASATDVVMHWWQRQRRQPGLRIVDHFHDDPDYIDALVRRVRGHWQVEGRGQHLVMSFHGMPARTLRLGDPYHCECLKTARLLADRLGLPSDGFTVTFQSRFGRAKWLQPYTEPTLLALAQRGVHEVDVVCPGFVSDCLETLEEIALEARVAFEGAGGTRLGVIPCLNDQHEWIAALASIALRHLQGWAVDDGSDGTEARAAQRARALALGASD